MTAGKPDSPPPAYTTIPSIPSPSPSTAAHEPDTTSGGAPGFQPPHHTHVYGPTPIAQQQGTLLPYYDPRSPYAMAQAISRARWRFVGALLWALGIWAAFGIVTGGIVVDIRRA